MKNYYNHQKLKPFYSFRLLGYNSRGREKDKQRKQNKNLESKETLGFQVFDGFLYRKFKERSNCKTLRLFVLILLLKINVY